MADITRLNNAARNLNSDETAISRLPNPTSITPTSNRQCVTPPRAPLSPDYLLEAMFFLEETLLFGELISKDGEKKDQSQTDDASGLQRTDLEDTDSRATEECHLGRQLGEVELPDAATGGIHTNSRHIRSNGINTSHAENDYQLTAHATGIDHCREHQSQLETCHPQPGVCDGHLRENPHTQVRDRLFSDNRVRLQGVGQTDSDPRNPQSKGSPDVAVSFSRVQLGGEGDELTNRCMRSTGHCPSYIPSLAAYPYTSHLLPGHATTALPMLHDSEAPPVYRHEDDDVDYERHPRASQQSNPNPILGVDHQVHESVVRTADHPHPSHIQEPRSFSIIKAYFLCVTMGFLGVHHLYLGRRRVALMYASTFGLFGIGWILDLVRLRDIVADMNRKELENRGRGFMLCASPYGELREMSLAETVIWWLPPCGLFGGHHYALGRRRRYAGLQAATFGFFTFGWLVDLFRLKSLVRRRNHEIQRFVDGEAIPDNPGEDVNLEDAYVCCGLLGFLGIHHAYMRQPWLFALYFCTFGLVGIGWVHDLIRLPTLVARRKIELRQGTNPLHFDNAYLLLCTFGFIGFHHFYLRRIGWGILYLFTFGVFGFGCYYDHFRLQDLVKDANRKRRLSPDQNVYRRHLVPFRVPLDGAGRPDWEARTAWLSDPVQARRYQIQQAGLRAGADDGSRMQIGARTRDEDLSAVFVPPEEELPSLPQPPQIHDSISPPPSYREHLLHDRLPTEVMINNPDRANI